jgi:hypothetical protein
VGGHALESATSERTARKLEEQGVVDQISESERRRVETTRGLRSDHSSAIVEVAHDRSRWISRQKVPLSNWLQLGRMVSVSRATAAIMLLSTLCVGLLVAAAVTATVMRSNGRGEYVARPQFVAKLTGTHQVKWADDATAPMVDQLLTEGQTVQIVSGWAEITFKSGGRLVLEGPAKLQIQKDDSARLIEGKVATDEMVRRVGFTLDTPTGRIVDLGAEYGVTVDADRTMEVDVFSGTAEVRPITAKNGNIGPAQRVTANQFVRTISEAKKGGGTTTLEHLAASDNHFVRTMRSKTFELGSQCIGRSQRDDAKGTVCILRDPTPNSGRAVKFSFYNVHADVDRWITPIIFAFDRSTGTYRVTGIGQSVLNLGSGLQTVPFQLIVGSDELQAGVHTFGFYHGTIDKTGKATSASYGPLDFENVPPPDEHSKANTNEARWLFVPGESTPVKLRLELEFNTAPKTGQTQVGLWPGTKRYTKERIYSGRLEIVNEPQFPPVSSQNDLVARLLQIGSYRNASQHGVN